MGRPRIKIGKRTAGEPADASCRELARRENSFRPSLWMGSHDGLREEAPRVVVEARHVPFLRWQAFVRCVLGVRLANESLEYRQGTRQSLLQCRENQRRLSMTSFMAMVSRPARIDCFNIGPGSKVAILNHEEERRVEAIPSISRGLFSQTTELLASHGLRVTGGSSLGVKPLPVRGGP